MDILLFGDGPNLLGSGQFGSGLLHWQDQSFRKWDQGEARHVPTLRRGQMQKQALASLNFESECGDGWLTGGFVDYT